MTIDYNEREFLVKTAGQTNREIIPEYFADVSFFSCHFVYFVGKSFKPQFI